MTVKLTTPAAPETIRMARLKRNTMKPSDSSPTQSETPTFMVRRMVRGLKGKRTKRSRAPLPRKWIM